MKRVVLTVKSMRHRPLSVSLTFLTLLISCILLISVSKLQTSVRSSFERSISGVDLIVGPEAGPVNLLLYAMFRIGDPLSSIDYKLYQSLQKDPSVAWTLPLSMGDSHRGYRVLATSADYFDHFQIGEGEKLSFSVGDGSGFSQRFDTVILGSKVAEELGYELGKRITISHGVGDVSFEEHTNVLFEVTGILEPTGTPVDRSLHVSLEGLEAMHAGWSNLDELPEEGQESLEEVVHDLSSMDVEQISVLLVSLKSKLMVFELQRKIQEIPGYQAILPGVAFQQFWQIIEICESILQLISLLVFFCTLTGMVCAMIAALRERKREMAILRSIGGSPSYIAALLLGESLILVILASLAGYTLSVLGLQVMADILSAEWGIYMASESLYLVNWSLVMVMVGLGLVAGLVPAALAYRASWNTSLSPQT